MLRGVLVCCCCRMTAFDKDNLHIIFSNLVMWWLHKFNYGQNISKLGKSLVAATLDVYEQVQQQLLPTPTKSHYTFNLRDVSKVFQVCRNHTAYFSASVSSHARRDIRSHRLAAGSAGLTAASLGSIHHYSRCMRCRVFVCVLVLQGMTKAAGSLETTPAGIKLWVHEVLRASSTGWSMTPMTPTGCGWAACSQSSLRNTSRRGSRACSA